MENLIVNEGLLRRAGIGSLFLGRIVLPEKARRGENLGRARRTERISFIKSDSGQLRVLSSSENPLKAGKEIITGLDKIGLEAKPFCFHRPGQNEKNFLTQGENSKWIVARIADYAEQDKVPTEMFRKLAVLKEHRIKYGGIAIAFPMKGKAVEKIDEELKAMADSFSSLAGTIGCLAALPFTIIAEFCDEMAKDPVLLVKFGSFKGYDLYIELGRWE